MTAGLWSSNWLAELPWLNSDLCIAASGTPVAKTKVENVAAQPLSNNTALERHRAREGKDLHKIGQYFDLMGQAQIFHSNWVQEGGRAKIKFTVGAEVKMLKG